MTEAPEKLTTGEPLGIEDLLKYLPAWVRYHLAY
jgi:hypothetical protein